MNVSKGALVQIPELRLVSVLPGPDGDVSSVAAKRLWKGRCPGKTWPE